MSATYLESWPALIWMAIKHWFFEFEMCEGCRMDMEEKRNPTL